MKGVRYMKAMFIFVAVFVAILYMGARQERADIKESCDKYGTIVLDRIEYVCGPKIPNKKPTRITT